MTRRDFIGGLALGAAWAAFVVPAADTSRREKKRRGTRS
ncbi:MAG: twin-arginine translocation signal domain-containing protein [Kiritimatiellae bacterium]|nr:twin-arginine translocation signal domain-containing protein [Kiritimatiellia bacterium]